ncbi:hypothetical protein ACHAW5_002701 [Stephanodiscus triporus]|uniref:Uncharacterized protein n=1 Tax=Stephanodiscus triporus TaxID=2934178 RepID=A0ABD3N6N2_9STRA
MISQRLKGRLDYITHFICLLVLFIEIGDFITAPSPVLSCFSYLAYLPHPFSGRKWHDEDGGGGSGGRGGIVSLNSECLSNNGIDSYIISPQTIRETMGECDHSSSKGGAKPYMG